MQPVFARLGLPVAVGLQGELIVQDLDHNPRTLRSLPLGSYRVRARKRSYRLIWLATLGLIALGALLQRIVHPALSH